MSDNFLRLIPSSPSFVPNREAITKANTFLKEEFPTAGNINVEIYDSTQFIDQGANWICVLCPNCNLELGRDWWQVAMDQAYATAFNNLATVVPCCGTKTTLNDLRYDWPAGFSKFKIEIRDPTTDINELQFHQLESILGISLRKIWAHY